MRFKHSSEIERRFLAEREQKGEQNGEKSVYQVPSGLAVLATDFMPERKSP